MPNKPKPVQAIKQHQPPKRKLTTAERDYGSNHERYRTQVMQEHPLCQYRGTDCTGFSEHAHHLVRPATGPESYMAVCEKCHQEIHRRERDAM